MSQPQSTDGYWRVDPPSADRERMLGVVDGVRQSIELALRIALANPQDSDITELEETIQRFVAVATSVLESAEVEGSGGESSIPPMLERSPLSGRANPRSVRWTVAVEADSMTADFDYPFSVEGPPGAMHGGIIAAAFDELLGMAQHAAGQVGMTRRLSVTYHRPTPTGAPLRMQGGVSSVDGRRTTCWGTLRAGETLTAEAEAVFIAPRKRPG